WLEIEVSGDGAMTPRHRLVSVPYSFRAENANNSDELNYQSASYYLNASNINAGTLSDSRLSANVTRLGSTIEYTEISNNIVSSIDGVTNDGGNIDLVAGTNMTITPNDIANTITFDASTSGDNLGNHTATQNINLNGHYLSGDGENEGIYVPNNGKVGINTNSPVYNLDVVGDGFWAMAVRSGVTNFYEAVIIEDSGWQPDLTVEGSMKVSKDTFLATDSGNVGIGTTSPIYPLHMGSGAYCSAVGAWTNASSRKYKENIEELTKEKAISVLKQLKPVEFNYKIDKEDKYVGFISEDVPELVATKDRKGLCSMDIVGVLTKVVQEQQTINEGLLQRISELEKEIKQLKKQK
ncbi:tail fiber domain-containing protein, partial [bacterium]|nr:tail fiber domain-containing protein [bacterium]